MYGPIELRCYSNSTLVRSCLAGIALGYVSIKEQTREEERREPRRKAGQVESYRFRTTGEVATVVTQHEMTCMGLATQLSKDYAERYALAAQDAVVTVTSLL